MGARKSCAVLRLAQGVMFFGAFQPVLAQQPAAVSAPSDTRGLPIEVRPIKGLSYESAVALGVPLGVLVGNVEPRQPVRALQPASERDENSAGAR